VHFWAHADKSSLNKAYYTLFMRKLVIHTDFSRDENVLMKDMWSFIVLCWSVGYG